MEDTGSFRLKPQSPDIFATTLHDLAFAEGSQQRVAFRRAFAELAKEHVDGPGPLEGVAPTLLAVAAKNALASNFLDDLEWLAPEAAGRALFTFASALPIGNEQRELGRRALSRLLAGTARTFAAIATVMARVGAKAFGSAPVVARTSLLVELPLSSDVADGPLALMVASRKQLARDWLLAPSTRSLSARRLAARMIERAAAEVARRNDATARRFFSVEGPLQTAFERLLADRESLVWRHAAIARGLLAAQSEAVQDELARCIQPSLSPTEWRRAATSIAALAGSHPEKAAELAAQLFTSDVPKRDPGVATAFAWGLGRAADSEPDAALLLFHHALAGPPDDVADAALFVGRESGSRDFIERLNRSALSRLRSAEIPQNDDGAIAQRREVLRDLDPSTDARADDPVRAQIDKALELFVTTGAKASHALGLEALAGLNATVDALDALSSGADAATGPGSITRRTIFSVLRDVDASFLERDVLTDLLRLDTNVDKVRANEEALGALRTRVAKFILEGRDGADGGGDPSHLVFHFARLRALLHVVDSDANGWIAPSAGADESARQAERTRWLSTSKAVLARIEARPPRALRRALLATLARSLDGLVRTQACDVVDALLVVAVSISDSRDFDALGEASMDPDLRHAFAAYATFLRVEAESAPQSLADAKSNVTKIDALDVLADAIATIGSARSDALRAVLGRLGAGLATIARARSLRSVATASGEIESVQRLESAALALQQMCAGARSRASEPTDAGFERPPGARALSTALTRVVSGGDEELDPDGLALGASQLSTGLPRAIAELVRSSVLRLGDLPTDGSILPAAPAAEEPLPEWVPARRVLGAFYVLRPLGAGAAGSVYVVCRAEDKRDPSAERFALKVPDYSANAARHLSETEFFNLFRAEASALVALPPHPNLAQLVTFDLSSRPRPILVMELVEGPSLERSIEAGTMDLAKCFRVLDEVLAGLETMHEASVGHLDVKPANVVLRHGEMAVLVDFGLAGRNIRPGCVSGPYGAPEVWGATAEGVKPKPMPADIYAFGCLAFELLTGRQLFVEESEVAMISSHITHDGLPPRLRALSANPKLQPLVEVLFATLRRDPSARLKAPELRGALRGVAKTLEGTMWPLDASPPPQRSRTPGPRGAVR